MLLVCMAAALLTGCSRDADPPMTGYAEADLVYVGPAAAGRLQSLHVQRGDSVKAGQPLFALDPEPDVHQRDAAAERTRQAQAQVADLSKGRRPDEIRAIEERLVQARAQLTASTSQLERRRQLVAQGFMSAVQLDELISARDTDDARVRELQAQLALARQGARDDEQAAAQAAVQAAQADLALAAYNAAQTARAAPVDAAVYDTLYRVGEWVGAGTPVVALLPPGSLKLRFFVPEPALAHAAVGKDVAVACDGCASGLRARIRWVSPQAEFTPPVIYSNQTRAKLVFMAEAVPLGDAAALKPGQPIDVRFAAAAQP